MLHVVREDPEFVLLASLPPGGAADRMVSEVSMARPASKFANGDDDDLRALRRMRDEHPLKSHRRRAGAMVMSMRRFDAKTIARTIEAKSETV